MRHDFGLASLLSCLVLAGSQASATAMYVYQGENFTAIADDTPPSGTYTTDMAISGFIEIATPLAPDLLPTDITADVISFSFSDGRTTFTSSSPGVIFALDQVQTDLNGEIWAWDLRVSKGNALAPPLFFEFQIRSTPIGDSALIAECPGGAPSCNPREGIFQDGASIDGGFFGTNGGWTLVPEPSSAMLLATGLTALAHRRRTRLDSVAPTGLEASNGKRAVIPLAAALLPRGT